MNGSGDLVIGRSGDRNTNSSLPRWTGYFLRAGQTLVAAIREIFDESAYDRFLARTGASRSTATYRQFLREQEEVILRKPRCC